MENCCDENDILKRWEEYVQELYDGIRVNNPTQGEDNLNLIPQEEIVQIIHKLKNGKSAGPDNLPIEFWNISEIKV